MAEETLNAVGSINKELKIITVNVNDVSPHHFSFFERTKEDAQAIALSIAENGLKHLPSVTPDYINIGKWLGISGNTRIAAFKILGIEQIPVLVEEYSSEDKIKAAIIAGNEATKLTEYQTARIIEFTKQMWGRKPGTRTDKMRLGETEKGTTDERLAVRFKKSPATINKYLNVLRNRPELFDDIEKGNMSVDGACKLIKFIKKYALEKEDITVVWNRLIDEMQPKYHQRITSGEFSIEEAFFSCIRGLSTESFYTPKKEVELNNTPLQTSTHISTDPGQDPEKEISNENSQNEDEESHEGMEENDLSAKEEEREDQKEDIDEDEGDDEQNIEAEANDYKKEEELEDQKEDTDEDEDDEEEDEHTENAANDYLQAVKADDGQEAVDNSTTEIVALPQNKSVFYRCKHPECECYNKMVSIVKMEDKI